MSFAVAHGGSRDKMGSVGPVTRFDTVSFLTDYGTADEFVGVVKSVIRDIAPHVGVIDLTHEIPPFDVRAGSLALARCIGYVPSGVVLGVVDPGVGTSRRAVAIEVAGGAGVVIGPDNGLLAPAVAMAGGAERAFELSNVEYQLGAAGATFAGRDVFGPAAAHICNGVGLAELGPEVDPVLLLPGTVPLPALEDDELIAEVLWVDRFGNAQLNVGPDDLPPTWGAQLQLRIGAPTDPSGVSVRRAREGDHVRRARRRQPSGSSSTRTACSPSPWTSDRQPTNSGWRPVIRSSSSRSTTTPPVETAVAFGRR